VSAPAKMGSWAIRSTIVLATTNRGQPLYREGHERLGASIKRTSPAVESAAKLLTKDEARRIAANIAKLSKLPSRRAGAVVMEGRAWRLSTFRSCA
jgi:hypothetical protein